MQLEQSEGVFPKVFGFEEIDSTNSEFARMQTHLLPEYTAVIAGAQTLGKGRLGRSWQSPEGTSLSLSVLLRPQSSMERSWLTLLTALAVSKAANTLGVSASIKWPNDVLVQGKKLCGILATAIEDDVIMGIGVNLKSHEDLVDTAISFSELNVNIGIDEMAALIGTELIALLAEFRQNPEIVMEQFRSGCITLGQQVRAEFPDGKSLYGIAQSVNESGQLVILTPEPVALSAADVWHLRN